MGKVCYKLSKIYNETILNQIFMLFSLKNTVLLYFLVEFKILFYQSCTIKCPLSAMFKHKLQYLGPENATIIKNFCIVFFLVKIYINMLLYTTSIHRNNAQLRPICFIYTGSPIEYKPSPY